MRLRYVGPHQAVQLPDLDGKVVKRGETVDVPAGVGQSLLTQAGNWEQVKPAGKQAKPVGGE